MLLDLKYYLGEAKRELKFIVGFFGLLGAGGGIAFAALKNDGSKITLEKAEQPQEEEEEKEIIEHIGNLCERWQGENWNQEGVKRICE